MVRKKKSGFLTFCFSLMPGAGEMYLGFMKMGISLMGLFFSIIVLCSLLNVFSLLFVEVVTWFYSFFHVHNLAGLTDEEFLKVEDDYLFHPGIFSSAKKDVERYRKIIAIALIIIGVLLLWNGMKSALMPWIPDYIFKVLSRFENTIPRILAGIGIIIGGLRMIQGKEEELKEVVIDVEPADVEEEKRHYKNEEEPERELTPGRTAERKTYGAETERKDS